MKYIHQFLSVDVYSKEKVQRYVFNNFESWDIKEWYDQLTVLNLYKEW